MKSHFMQFFVFILTSLCFLFLAHRCIQMSLQTRLQVFAPVQYSTFFVALHSQLKHSIVETHSAYQQHFVVKRVSFRVVFLANASIKSPPFKTKRCFTIQIIQHFVLFVKYYFKKYFILLFF